VRRTVVAYFLWLITTCGGAFGQNVFVDAATASALNELAKDSVEHVACLYGFTRPDSVFVISYALPRQAPIGTHNVTDAADDCAAALVHWHSHTVPKDSVAPAYLYYSLTDEHSFINTTQAMLAAVGVPGGWCIWTRLQVLEGYHRNLTPLPPVRSQCFPVP
jgi:hypothetical protein